jgi:hypothetical protein
MDNIKNSPLFFIHIPKTAGSSFRKAAEDYFGIDYTFYDYARQSVETHPKIIEFIYDKKDFFAAGSYITQHARFLSGHVHYVKYAPFFHPNNVITFIRSPEQQVRSHFEHFVRDKRYIGSFEAFIADKRYANVQSRILGGLGIQGYGFIGLTEDYETSIALINALYNTNFKALDLNKNKAKNQPSYILTQQELDLIHQHNKEDFALYAEACIRFERQKKAIEESRPFIRFGLLPLPPQQALHKINGWLTCHESNEAQALNVYINGTKTETLIANEYRNIANERNMNRKGFIGFTYHFPKDIKHHDKIDFYAESNNELLHSMHYQLPNQN